jgi:DNA polymerase-3 subunit epsilon
VEKRMMRQIVLDTETTGLSPEQGHRIIEIGCLELINRKITGNHYHTYINPQRPVDAGAVQVHGLTSEFLLDKPLFSDIEKDFLAFIEGAELIIHNAPFDVGFINCEFKLMGKGFSPVTKYCAILDTLAMARSKHPGMHNNLDALCKRYSVDNANRDLHGALLDAQLLAQVYLLMTGGQRQLFDADDDQENRSRQEHATVALDKKAPLEIISASPEELVAHDEFLQNMKKRGACLWLD